jgi:hypothetical protein
VALDLIDELDGLIALLDRAGIEYAVCGGLALAVHGHPRATEDIDLLVRHEVLGEVLRIAKGSGFDIPARPITFGLRTGTPRKVQRVSKLDPDTNDLVTLDLLDVSPDLEDVWEGRISIPWRGKVIRVVSVDGLLKMKRIAGRPQDLLDIAKLTGTSTDDEEP